MVRIKSRYSIVTGFFSGLCFALKEKTLGMKYCLISSLFLLLLFFFLISCKKDVKDCFDAELQEKSKAVRCSSECPGIVGCDGKTYCNECVAGQSGIRPK